MTSEASFYILAICTVVTALAVVTQRNVLHAGLSLIICFWCVGGIYLVLDAPFLAAIQVLIYVGAISVLLLFAIMLTHRLSSLEPPVPSGRATWGVILALLFMILGGATYSKVPVFDMALPLFPATTILDLATNFMSPQRFLAPFEIVGILLLVALVAAVIIARKDESAGAPQ